MTEFRDKKTSAGNGRLKLVLIMLVFLAPIVAAGVLTLTGWQPEGRGNGHPIVPQRSMAGINLIVDGKPWAWRDDQPRLTLVAIPGPDCATHCVQTLKLMRNAHIVLNRNADRLRLVYIGMPPHGAEADTVLPDWKIAVDPTKAFDQFRPTESDTVAAVLVESNATALSYYPAGFDPNGLRKDLQKVIR